MHDTLNTNPPKTRLYRLVEMSPGIATWITIFGALLSSYFAPLWAVYIVIVFDVYWIIKVLYWVIHLFHSYKRYLQTAQIDWLHKLQDHPKHKEMLHIVFLPTYKEGKEIIEQTVQALSKSTFPTQRIVPVLALEEKDSERAVPIAEELKQKYKHIFFDLLVTVHPYGKAGEIPGKGSNTNWAGHQITQWLKDNHSEIPHENIIVSSFDIDSVVAPQYFAYLSYTYLTHPDPTHASYQPIPMFNNNIWTSTSFARVTANSTTFWLLAELARPERLFTFSSHSMSLKALIDVGYWQKDIVSEDSRIFLQCYIKNNGNYKVVPLFMPVSMDNVHAGSFWKTVQELYKQQRRWAWGVENLPYMVHHFAGNKKIPRKMKWYYIFNQAEGMYTWATAPIIIFVLGRFPFWIGQGAFQDTAIRQSAPVVLHYLLSSAMIGMFAVGLLSLFLLPKRPDNQPRWKYLMVGLQWILLPITMVVFGAIPAIDAQTRLMLNKPLGFRVTEKKR